MRLQLRFEITEGIGDVRTAYPRLNRNENAVLQEIDRRRMERWDAMEARGHYLIVLTLAVEKASTIEELRAVAERTLTQIAERRGEARAAAARRVLFGG